MATPKKIAKAKNVPAKAVSAKSSFDLKSSLNPTQLTAVTAENGPQLVVAGAGSGKTRVLTYRIAYLVSKGIAPHRILAVTFTNKAAQEMATRVDRLVGKYVPISTFHSFCLKVLRANREKIGFEKGFVIYDQNDQLMLLKECMRRQDIGDKRLKPQYFANAIGLAKDRLESADKYAKRAEKSKEYNDELVAKVYKEYEKELKRVRALDFDDLIMRTVLLFKREPEVLKFYQNSFDYILVDEYQDTNYAQYQLVRMLSEKHRNLFVVGDPDQSIYRFRGAEIGNILSFEKDYPEAKKTVLERNYRSTQAILDAANDVIAQNSGRWEKNLTTENPAGKKVSFYSAKDEHEETDEIIRQVKKLLREGYKRHDIVVFYRVHLLSRLIEEAMVKNRIPYKLVGDTGFYSRREIKDQLAYMRAALNNFDDVSLRRIINSPTRGLGETTQETLASFAQTAGITFYEAIEQHRRIDRFTDAVHKKLQKFLDLMQELTEAQKNMLPTEFLNFILEKTEYIEKICPGDDEEDVMRRENIGELLSAVADYENTTTDEKASTEGFLNEVAITADIDKWNDEADTLTLMTIHNAKGLEFPVVFIMGMEEDLFPHINAKGIKDEIEEERRLCYVGMTRAKERLFLSCALKRVMFGVNQSRDPSRFLGEIASNHVERRFSSRKILLSESTSTQKLPSKPAGTVDTGELTVGMAVVHTHFGNGVISSISGEGESARLTIEFENLPAPKVLVAKYAKLKPLKSGTGKTCRK